MQYGDGTIKNTRHVICVLLHSRTDEHSNQSSPQPHIQINHINIKNLKSLYWKTTVCPFNKSYKCHYTQDNDSKASLLLQSEHSIDSKDARLNLNHPYIKLQSAVSCSKANYTFTEVQHTGHVPLPISNF